MVSLTLGILAGNLCPPESLGSVSLYPRMQNTLCLPMRIRLKCVQSSRLLERKKEIVWHVFFFCFFFPMSGLLDAHTYLCTIIYTASHCLDCVPYVFMFTSPVTTRYILFMCLFARLCVCAV